jgi:hypothetical protein
VNPASAGTLRTVTFGDLEAGVWGAVWGAEEPFATLGRVDGAELPSLGMALEGSDDGEDWRIVSDRVELTLTPAAAAAPAGSSGFDQLCRVRGRVALDGEDTTVDCLGRRGSRAEHPDFGRFDSLRDVSAWFEPAEGIALVSLRPRRAAGHSDDLISAVLFEPEATVAVAEPRLSTTYTAAGEPSRLSLELWPDSEHEGGSQIPRRAAGEAIGARARSRQGELDISAELLRCHSHGREGAGVYLLVRPV